MRRSALANWLFMLLMTISLSFQILQPTDTVQSIRRLFRGVFSAGPRAQEAALRNTVGWLRNLASLVKAREENRRLQEQVLDLLRQNEELRALRAENERLSKVLGYQRRLGRKSVVAWCYGRDPKGAYQTLSIEKGSADGVRAEQPAVAFSAGKMGLVGRVIESSEHTAEVMVITNAQFSAYGRSAAGADGEVRGQDGPTLQFNYLEQDKPIAAGDIVSTVGGGRSIFPAGLPIGAVRVVHPKPYGAFSRAEIEPVIDPVHVRELYILVD